jgi:hypothetical protein
MKNFSVEYFVELIGKIAESSIADDIVFDWLDAAVDRVEGDYQFVQDRCRETGYDEESPDEINWGLRALENYRESLGLLEDYFQVGDVTFLQQAAELAVSVHQMFVAAADENKRVSEEEMLNLCC